MRIIRRIRKSKTYSPDWVLIMILVLLVIFGLLMLASAGVSVGYEKYADSYYFVKKQLWFGVLPGLFLFVICSFIDYRVWQKYSLHLFIFSIILLILVFVPSIGDTLGGASRWIDLGFFRFQPSEFVKLTFLFFIASWLTANTKNSNNFTEHFLYFLFYLSLVVFLLLLQPDMSTSFMLVVIGLVSYFIANGNIGYLLGLSVFGSGLFYILIQKESYRMKRLMTFLHPELDPLGIGYHINQALLAVGSGGIFGRGYGQSRQKFMYLPEAVTDSVFAIISEELGFVIVCALVISFFIFFLRGVGIGQNAPDLFGKILAIGISTWLIVQVVVNIGAMIGLLPMTGIPLPFISYGRSSILISLASVGVLVNISRYVKK